MNKGHIVKRRQQTDRRMKLGRPTLAIAALTTAGLLTSACSLDDLDPRARATREIPPPPPPPTELTSPGIGSGSGSVSGIWEGTYTCNQGLTRMRLTLTQSSSGLVTGIFRFSADASNPSVPSGSYTVRGTVIGSSLSLRGNTWIVQPGNYEMVSLTARLSSSNPDQIQGSILSSGCSTFTVQRS